MSRINTNVQSLIAQRVLSQNNANLSQSLERLSTGLRISRGKDDPAGLIASENLRSEKAAINAAISNSERADQVVNIAEGGLQEVSSLLTELQGLVTGTANKAGISQSEREANQLQIDSILQTIDRIASATSFQGVKLLNGNYDYSTTGVSASVVSFQVNGAKLQQGQNLNVNAVVTTSAQQAGLYLSTNGALNLNGGVNSAFTIEISGNLGSRQLSFASGTTVATIASQINTFTDVTGIRASAGTTGIYLESSEFGSDKFASVKVINAANIQGTGVGIYNRQAQNFSAINTTIAAAYTTPAAQNGYKDNGQDIVATINGVAATAKGKTFSINTDFLNVSLTLNTTQAQTVGVKNAFTITGGGADFQLAGDVNIGSKVAIGIGDVAARKLGTTDVSGNLRFLSDLASGKTLNVVSGDITNAQKVISQSINQITSLRGRLGAFQKNTVGATIRSLGVSLENTTAAESVIRDADFATETAKLTRGQILVSAATQVLTLANSSPQSALQLLRG
ncbi:MAG: flagellin [Phycisphaeraceae bacterium]|nr:flagellin [Phycisphaeraceae bacterium]